MPLKYFEHKTIVALKVVFLLFSVLSDFTTMRPTTELTWGETDYTQL
ncbi:MAG: hypothetical protein H0U50_06050 [Pyrinomonadaceae bacterium]|nr:hypothetical protein [Pyrinomonadaceae bacterium]